jgi:hypothetical protein
MPVSPLREVNLPCESPGFIGLILAAPTGVLYRQQCGGFWCNMMSLEGYMVPIGRSEATETRSRPDDQFTIDSYDLRSFFHTEDGGCPWGFVAQMPPEQIDRLEAQVSLLRYRFYGTDWEESEIRFDRSKIDEAQEAWIPVTTPDGSGVLVWNNCD